MYYKKLTNKLTENLDTFNLRLFGLSIQISEARHATCRKSRDKINIIAYIIIAIY